MKTTKPNTQGNDITAADSDEVLDNLRDSSEEFFNKNKKVILTVGGVIILAVAGFFGYKYFQNEKNSEGQVSMIQAVMAWEKDSLNRALNGNPKKEEAGLISVSEDYSGTKAGELASFQAGVALLKQGKYEDAIEKLKDFHANDLLVQGIAYCRIGDAYLELKDYDNAVDYYTKASNYKPNEAFTPSYLIKLGLAQELKKDYQKAADAYNRIIEQYPTSKFATDAKKYKAKAEGLAKSSQVKK